MQKLTTQNGGEGQKMKILAFEPNWTKCCIHNLGAYREREMQKLSTQNDGGGGVKNENSIRNWHKNGWRYFYEISYLVQMSKIN